MSLSGVMRTGMSGMNAQTNRLSAVADNIANASTTGYKRTSTQFSSLLLSSTSGQYNSGAIQTQMRNGISEQGAIQYTSSSTDLAINGHGFFVVRDEGGGTYLTRAGSFVPNGDGELVNAAGLKLLGFPYNADGPTPVVNSYAGLKPLSIASGGLLANPSTLATVFANLNAGAETIASASLPSATSGAGTKYTHKTSVKVFNTLGREVVYDVYFSKVADNEWELTVFDQDSRDSSTGSFPYAAGALLTDPPISLTFDPETGKLDAASEASAQVVLDATGPNDMPPNMEEMTLDFSGLTQLAYKFSVRATVDGNAPSEVESIQISGDGIVNAQYQNGDLVPIYRLAMANVQSPDQLRVISGDLFAETNDSGSVLIGFANQNGNGSILSGALENSTVDLADELTTMIESQRSYTANSKVFQTAAELLDVVMSLHR